MEKLYKKQRGLSLVELMISITLGLVLIAGVIQVFLSSRVVFSTQQAMSRAQENGRLGMELISEDIRMAGYWGCANRDSPMASDLPATFWDNYVLGSEPNSVQSMVASTISGLVPAPIADMPALVLRYATGAPLLLTAQSGTTSVTVSGSVENNCIGEVCVNKPTVISNCVAARIFKPTAISESGSAQITHDGNWNNNSITSIHDVFYPGAEVLAVNTIVFYLANNTAGTPSLYRHDSLSGTAVEVIEGVENIHFEFSVNDAYVAASAVSNWLDVGSVRVEMLVRGGDQKVLTDDHSYYFAGKNTTPAEARRLYQVFASTIAIRSRAD